MCRVPSLLASSGSPEAGWAPPTRHTGSQLRPRHCPSHRAGCPPASSQPLPSQGDLGVHSAPGGCEMRHLGAGPGLCSRPGLRVGAGRSCPTSYSSPSPETVTMPSHSLSLSPWTSSRAWFCRSNVGNREVRQTGPPVLHHCYPGLRSPNAPPPPSILTPPSPVWMRLKDSPASEIMGSTWSLHHCHARPRPPKGLINRSNRGGLGRSSGVISAERGEGVYTGQDPRPLGTSETVTANSAQWNWWAAGNGACWEFKVFSPRPHLPRPRCAAPPPPRS